MKIQISLSAASKSLHFNTLQLGLGIKRVKQGKSFFGVVIELSQADVAVRFSGLGVERYTPDVFNRMVAKGGLRSAPAAEVASVKGTLRKDAHRERKEGSRISSVSNLTDLENKLRLQIQQAYEGEQNVREDTLIAIQRKALFEGFYKSYIKSHPMAADLESTFPGCKIEPTLPTDMPSASAYNAGNDLLRPLGLSVRIKGIPYIVRIVGTAAPYSVTVGNIGTIKVKDADQISAWLKTKMAAMTSNIKKTNVRIANTSAKTRFIERDRVHFAAWELLKTARSNLAYAAQVEKALKRAGLVMKPRGPNLVRLVERVVEHWKKVEKQALPIADATGGTDDVVSSGELSQIKRLNSQLVEVADKADTLQNDMESAMQFYKLTVLRKDRKRTR